MAKLYFFWVEGDIVLIPRVQLAERITVQAPWRSG
jgi:hypothetical protein